MCRHAWFVGRWGSLLTALNMGWVEIAALVELFEEVAACGEREILRIICGPQSEVWGSTDASTS